MDFIMSTIALQHIPVYDIRNIANSCLITEIGTKNSIIPGGLFSFQIWVW